MVVAAPAGVDVCACAGDPISQQVASIAKPSKADARPDGKRVADVNVARTFIFR